MCIYGLGVILCRTKRFITYKKKGLDALVHCHASLTRFDGYVKFECLVCAYIVYGYFEEFCALSHPHKKKKYYLLTYTVYMSCGFDGKANNKEKVNKKIKTNKKNI